jgi:hypothetical protein
MVIGPEFPSCGATLEKAGTYKNGEGRRLINLTFFPLFEKELNKPSLI